MPGRDLKRIGDVDTTAFELGRMLPITVAHSSIAGIGSGQASDLAAPKWHRLGRALRTRLLQPTSFEQQQSRIVRSNGGV